MPLPKRPGSVADSGKSFDQVADSQSTEHILCRKAQRYKPRLPLRAFPFTPGQVIEVYPTQRVRERTMQYSEGEIPVPIFSSQGKGAWLLPWCSRQAQLPKVCLSFGLSPLLLLPSPLGSLPGFFSARTVVHPWGPNALYQ